MATKTEQVKHSSNANCVIVTWSAIANGESGDAAELFEYSDKTMQIFGTFGAGGSVTIQGSNDPRVISDPGNAVWFTLVDPQTTTLVKTSAGGDAIIENPRFIRPTCTAGDGTTSLTVIVVGKA